MKKISLIGLVLVAVLGIVAGLMAGSWLFWLGMGLVAGVLDRLARAAAVYYAATPATYTQGT